MIDDGHIKSANSGVTISDSLCTRAFYAARTDQNDQPFSCRMPLARVSRSVVCVAIPVPILFLETAPEALLAITSAFSQ